MKWVLPFDWDPQSNKRIESKSTLFFLGSCFAENIAEQVSLNRINVTKNPFGILYNPISMAHAFTHCLNGSTLLKEDLFFHNNLWHSEMHHGAFSDTTQENTLQKINNEIINAAEQLNNSDFIFLTFGTAKVYKSKATGKIVGNCHKRPLSDFETSMLDVATIMNQWDNLITQCPDKEFYLSISPVRYVREGLIESNHSKAILRIAIQQLIAKHPNVYYFPAFELITDVLRDYRFYHSDLVHPNAQAIEFVYDFFHSKLFAEQTKQYVTEWRKIDAMFKHKALQPESPQWREFEIKRKNALESFNKKWH